MMQNHEHEEKRLKMIDDVISELDKKNVRHKIITIGSGESTSFILPMPEGDWNLVCLGTIYSGFETWREAYEFARRKMAEENRAQSARTDDDCPDKYGGDEGI